jgi:glycosyltransferase involved in cell wall biosynthesis
MKSIIEMGMLIKSLIEFRAHNNELKVIPEVEYNYCKKQELKKKDHYKIVFITNGMNDFSGGNTSILRLGTYLHYFGHEIYYISYDNSNKTQMKKSAEVNLPGYKGIILEKSALYNQKYDIAIVTFWLSCYTLLTCQDNFDYKIYFIQDFEPFFYPVGDVHLLALNTYKFGFHMVSLGEWNKLQIESLTPQHVDFIDFPVETEQYKVKTREIIIKEEIRIALYIKLDSRRAPFLLTQQIKYLHEKLLESGYNLKVFAYGLNKLVKLSFITNLGRLKKDELIKLYGNCHFGLVASLTNISLVNYEMILSGLPVIDFADGSAPTFFTEEEMIFLDLNINDLFEKIIYYTDHQDELNQMLVNAQSKIINNKLTWENSAKQFNNLLFYPKPSR